MQAKNPKDQYLLLKALNEVIISISSGGTGKQLSAALQQEVCPTLWCTAAHEHVKMLQLQLSDSIEHRPMTAWHCVCCHSVYAQPSRRLKLIE